MTSSNAPLRPTLVPFRERWMGLIDFGQMWSTDKELPYLDRDEEPHGTWVGIGEFSGDVIPRKANCDPLLDPVTGERERVTGTWEGATALTIVGEDLLGIVAPENTSKPAVWFWVTTSGLTGFSAETGSTSSPVVTISADGWRLHVRDVARLEQPCWLPTTHESISLEPRGETSLLDALRNFGLPESGSSPLPPRDTSVPEPTSPGGLPGTDDGDATTPLPPRQWTEKLARKPVAITGAILQKPLESIRFGRNLRRLGLLGIGCAVTSREPPVSGGIPFSEFDKDADGSWTGLAMFVGEAALLDDDGVLHPAGAVVLPGSCALTLAGDRLLGILDEDDDARGLWSMLGVEVATDEANQSVWFAALRSDISLETSGEQGLLGKRPELLKLSTDGWYLHLRDVHNFTRACTRETAERRNSAQPRAENSLVAALASN